MGLGVVTLKTQPEYVLGGVGEGKKNAVRLYEFGGGEFSFI